MTVSLGMVRRFKMLQTIFLKIRMFILKNFKKELYQEIIENFVLADEDFIVNKVKIVNGPSKYTFEITGWQYNPDDSKSYDNNISKLVFFSKFGSYEGELEYN